MLLFQFAMEIDNFIESEMVRNTDGSKLPHNNLVSLTKNHSFTNSNSKLPTQLNIRV